MKTCFVLVLLVIINSCCYEVFGLYNKDVECVFNEEGEPICKFRKRSNNAKFKTDDMTPIYDPYIPRKNVKLYNCTETECKLLKLESIEQVTSPFINLKSCYLKAPQNYECERIRFNYLKNIDKLLFLGNAIPDKRFYMVDCLVYQQGDRICHSKDSKDSHAKLMNTGKVARPKESAILSQEEFVCQESLEGAVICDLNPYVPFSDGLHFKEVPNIVTEIVLKTPKSVMMLNLKCFSLWCGYTGHRLYTRRFNYKPPGGDIYRCFYAKRQQICMKVSNIYEEAYINQV